MTIVSAFGFLLILVGLWGMLTQRNIVKIIIGFSIIDTGIHLVMVSIGFIRGRTAPILDGAVAVGNAAAEVVDPVPSALVLTAIVIGLAVTALMLVYAVQLHDRRGSLLIDDFKELKW
ncbi:MAG: sodium:proton antiporter [Spirochaetaceae bacterium]